MEISDSKKFENESYYNLIFRKSGLDVRVLLQQVSVGLAK